MPSRFGVIRYFENRAPNDPEPYKVKYAPHICVTSVPYAQHDLYNVNWKNFVAGALKVSRISVPLGVEQITFQSG